MVWEERFEKWMEIAGSLENDNQCGDREQLLEYFSRELVEHVMYSLASKYIANGRDAGGTINRTDMRLFLMQNFPNPLSLIKKEVLVNHYLEIFWTEGTIDGCEPEPAEKMEALCVWRMGCSAIHWNQEINTYTSDQEIAEGMNMRTDQGDLIPRGLWEVGLLEKDHIWPKSKRNERYIGDAMRVNSQWLCSHHNRKWKGDKTTETIPARVWE